MSDKRKFPRAAAIAVAKEICNVLKPLCDRLVVAGSLRRRKMEVGDVEILYVPKIRMVKPTDDFFAPPAPVNDVDSILISLLHVGILKKRLTMMGSETWGLKNKLAIHVKSGIPVDFFAAAEENWFNYLVCRTGGAQNNVEIASAAQRKGWKWHPYGAGFTDQHGGTHFVMSEEEVFELAGLKYKQPWERS